VLLVMFTLVSGIYPPSLGASSPIPPSPLFPISFPEAFGFLGEAPTSVDFGTNFWAKNASDGLLDRKFI